MLYDFTSLTRLNATDLLSINRLLRDAQMVDMFGFHNRKPSSVRMHPRTHVPIKNHRLPPDGILAVLVGVEPTLNGSKPFVLPLHHSTLYMMVAGTGFEPVSSAYEADKETAPTLRSIDGLARHRPSQS